MISNFDKNDNTSWFRAYPSTTSLGDFPMLRCIGTEIINNPAYHWQGADRVDHPHNIIQYTISGVGIFEKDGIKREISAGQAFIVYSHDPMSGYYYSKNATEPWHVLFIDFQRGNQFLKNIIDAYGHIFEFEQTSEHFQGLLEFKNQKYVDNVMPFTDNCLLVTEALCEIASYRTNLEVSELESAVYRKVINYINLHLNQGCSVAEIAVHVGVTKEHLSRLVRAETGQKLSVYIREKRMEHAAKLLRNTTMTVQEVARELNFNVSSNFSRTFKAVYSKNPREFRCDLISGVKA